MTAYNIVRFRVKPGRESEFVAAHKNMKLEAKGMRKASLVKTGDRAFFLVGEWDSFDDIVAARPKLISLLDAIRGMLEDLGSGLGVTDPVSGAVVVELKLGG